MQFPTPWAGVPHQALADAAGVFTDIDDTLTQDGAITPQALSALQRLRDAGIPVIAITGRPMGWSTPFARAWPLAALVAENGAVALLPDGSVEYAQDAATRAANALRLKLAAERVLHEVPGARLARDSVGRMTDIAVDHSEFERLSAEQIARVVAVMRGEGLNATVSSIHVNGWYGSHDKLSGARWMVRRLYGRMLDEELPRWVYVGDSTNDQQMFARFPLSVGVANLRHFERELTVWPAYITEGERGAGFAEVADRLVASRAQEGAQAV